MKQPAGSVLTEHLVLRPLTRELARAILDGDRTGRHWSRGYPTDGDKVVADLLLQLTPEASTADAPTAASAGTAPSAVHFGLYEVAWRPDRPDDEAGLTVGGIGFFGPPGVDGQVEVGYGLAEEVRGRGLATEAVLALVDAATRDPRVVAVRARVSPDNPASRRVVEKAGFTMTGHDDSDPQEPLVVFTRRITPRAG